MLGLPKVRFPHVPSGSEGLGLQPWECVFVDDDPHLVSAAIALGYEGARHVCRDRREPPSDVSGIGSLADIVDVFGW